MGVDKPQMGRDGRGGTYIYLKKKKKQNYTVRVLYKWTQKTDTIQETSVFTDFNINRYVF